MILRSWRRVNNPRNKFLGYAVHFPRCLGIFLLGLILSACSGDQKKVESEPLNPATLQAIPIQQQIQVGEKYENMLEPNPQRLTLLVEQPAQLIFQIMRMEGDAAITLEVFDPAGNSLTQVTASEHTHALTNPLSLAELGEYTLLVSATSSGFRYNIIQVDTSPTATPTETLPPTETELPSPTVTETATIPPTFRPASATPAPSLTPAPTGGRLEVDQTHEGEITQPDERQRFTFLATTEQTLTIAANPTSASSLDPLIEIQAPDGEIIAQNDNWRENIPDAILSFSPPSTGVYTLYLSSAGGTGGYLLTLSSGFTVRDVEQGEAALNTEHEQRLETYGGRDVWTAELNAADVITVDVQAVDPEVFNVMAELVAPNGEVWFDDNSGENNNALISDITAPVSGTYTIHIAGNNNASIGDYRLLVRRLNDFYTPTPTNTPTATITLTPSVTFTPTPPTPGAPSDSINASVEPNSTYVYVIELEAGQSVNVVVIGLEGFDPVLQIIDPTDKMVVEVDDIAGATDPRIRFTADTNGLYRLEVSGFEGSGGIFTLSYITQ